MANPEAMGSESRDTNSNYEKWKTLEQRRFLPPAECKFNKNGDAVFFKFGDTIRFGETPNTQRVDSYPNETNEDDYNTCVVEIETSDGNVYYVNQGIFLDTKNAKYVDILENRKKVENKGKEYKFPDITIGYQLPFDKIPYNSSQLQAAYVMRISFLGNSSGKTGDGHEKMEKICDYMTALRKSGK